MDEKQEELFKRGSRAAYLEMLGVALRGLGRPDLGDPDTEKLTFRIGQLEAERAATVAALRRLCTEHSSNEWRDDLFLPDVIDKHLASYLGR